MYVKLTQAQEDLLEIGLTQLRWFIFKDLPISGLRISREGPEYSPFPRGPLYILVFTIGPPAGYRAVNCLGHPACEFWEGFLRTAWFLIN